MFSPPTSHLDSSSFHLHGKYESELPSVWFYDSQTDSVRGIISSTTIQKHFRNNEDCGFDWISALRATKIRSLVEQESIQLSLFDETNLAEISSDDYPGERLIACRNPMLAADRAKTREELLQATEKELSKIVAATTRQNKRLTGASNIALKVGKVVNRYKEARAFHTGYSREQF
ncbi:MAG: hypothetical protein HC849_34300 [Oscillatoriales cyanobacterium RU_3_3]|nr:hypothetical protein [Oscillatoriales cyanobacterium RU_3_3]